MPWKFLGLLWAAGPPFSRLAAASSFRSPFPSSGAPSVAEQRTGAKFASGQAPRPRFAITMNPPSVEPATIFHWVGRNLDDEARRSFARKCGCRFGRLADPLQTPQDLRPRPGHHSMRDGAGLAGGAPAPEQGMLVLEAVRSIQVGLIGRFGGMRSSANFRQHDEWISTGRTAVAQARRVECAERRQTLSIVPSFPVWYCQLHVRSLGRRDSIVNSADMPATHIRSGIALYTNMCARRCASACHLHRRAWSLPAGLHLLLERDHCMFGAFLGRDARPQAGRYKSRHLHP